MRRLALFLLVATSLAAFAASLALPAFDTEVTFMIEVRMHQPSKSYQGYEAFLLGWGSLVSGCIAWLANPGYFVALALMFGTKRSALPFSVAAAVLALTSLAHPLIERGENGYDFHISRLDSGFYVWLVAIVLLCAATVVKPVQPVGTTSPTN